MLIEEVKKLLATAQKILITTHQRPDGDAIGSSLGLMHFLNKMGHQANFISPTSYPDFLKWMPGNNSVIVFTGEKEKCLELVKEATVIFCLDFNRLNRLEDFGSAIKDSTAPKILIDHHLDPEDFSIFRIWDTKATSTCELVFEFIMKLGEGNRMDIEIATCLYTGILTDTDRFRVPTTSPAVHRVVASLLEHQVNHTHVYQQIYESYSENKLRLIGNSISEKLEVFNDLKIGIIALEKQDMNRYWAQSGDTEGIVNYPLWIKDIKVSVLIIQRPNEVKISMRSKGDFSVEQICREYFNGGGHRNAAGGSSNLTVKETKEKIISILARFKKELNQ